jgi:hypothetical protein
LNNFNQKDPPSMPIGAQFLMDKYQMTEGKNLGIKLKNIEEEWVNNNFKLSEKQIDKISKSLDIFNVYNFKIFCSCGCINFNKIFFVFSN